jgi:hypothetical protein
MAGYDIIGDVHGNADKLEALLRTMDYREQGGAWQHSERTVVFVGDLIDRGPGQLRTIEIAHRMREAGSAQIVLGNHEFNAVAWANNDPDAPGTPLRPHTRGKRAQHEAFLAEVEEGSPDHRKLIAWFHTIPLWLDLDGVRVIHACWHPESMDAIGQLLDDGCLTHDLVVAASRKGSAEHGAIEVLLKGPEVQLPHPHHYLDKGGVKRTKARHRWWDPEARTYRTAAQIPEGSLTEDGTPMPQLPDEPLAETDLPRYADKVPLVVGHYWFSGAPASLTPWVACVDYSVGNGGPLVAYRWRGEAELHPDHFVGAG